jgi:ATP synthase protein I
MENGPEKPEIRDAELDARRDRLAAKLQHVKPDMAAEGTGDAHSQSAAGFAVALRLSSEFVAGIVVGASLGWFFDRALGTSPWGLIVFLLLGFLAGVLNVLRSAGLVAQSKPDSQTKRSSGS